MHHRGVRFVVAAIAGGGLNASATSAAAPKMNVIAAAIATRRGEGPPWMSVSCMTAWPLPRAISHAEPATGPAEVDQQCPAR
jgi:hypothetical protein